MLKTDERKREREREGENVYERQLYLIYNKMVLVSWLIFVCRKHDKGRRSR